MCSRPSAPPSARAVGRPARALATATIPAAPAHAPAPEHSLPHAVFRVTLAPAKCALNGEHRPNPSELRRAGRAGRANGRVHTGAGASRSAVCAALVPSRARVARAHARIGCWRRRSTYGLGRAASDARTANGLTEDARPDALTLFGCPSQVTRSFFRTCHAPASNSQFNGRRSHQSPQKVYVTLSRGLLGFLHSIGASSRKCHKKSEVT
jgi:hypothetical protein